MQHMLIILWLFLNRGYVRQPEGMLGMSYLKLGITQDPEPKTMLSCDTQMEVAMLHLGACVFRFFWTFKKNYYFKTYLELPVTVKVVVE